MHMFTQFPMTYANRKHAIHLEIIGDLDNIAFLLGLTLFLDKEALDFWLDAFRS
jgi:hypothetical protein